MPDTGPKITIERRTKDPITISKDDELPRPPDWIPLELKPDLIMLSEQGERKLADARMNAWAQDQVEFEERQCVEIEQRRNAVKKEQEPCIPKEKKEEHQRETPRACQSTPEELLQRWEQALTEEETRISLLSDEERREERKVFKEYVWDYLSDEPEEQTLRARWRVYQIRDERSKQERIAEQKRQAEEKKCQAKAKRQEIQKQEAQERARRIELYREAQRRKDEEKDRRLTKKWACLVQKCLETPHPTQFQSQITSLQKDIPSEIMRWRSQVKWKYLEGKAIRIDLQLPPPEKDSDLQSVRTAIWTKEMLKRRNGDELDQFKHDEIASLKWAIRPEGLTMEALWDESLYHRHNFSTKTQRERGKEIYFELEKRVPWKRPDITSLEQGQSELQEIWRWKTKYEKHMSGSTAQMMNERYRETEKKVQKFIRIQESWTKMMQAAQGESLFQIQVRRLKKEVPGEVAKWRKDRLCLTQEGTIRIKERPKLTTESEDLQAVEDALWNKEMLKFKEEDELKDYEYNRIASLRRAICPENLTMEALWDEYFYHKDIKSQRMTKIRAELSRRNVWIRQEDIDMLSAEQGEQKRQDLTSWCQKYRKTRGAFPNTWRWADSTHEALNKRLTDIGRKEDLRGEEYP
jgi:hypothetical protein